LNIIGYVIRSDNYKSEFARGFLNRSLNMLSGAMGGIIPPWKASSLYNETLDPTAVMIAVGRQDLSTDGKVREVWSKVNELLKKNEACCLVVEGVPEPPEGYLLPAFDGMHATLAYLYTLYFAEGAFNRYSDVALMLGEDSDSEWVEFFAEECNYLKFYARDRRITQEAIDFAYRYNGTAAEGTMNIGSLNTCDAVFCLDRKMADTARHLKPQVVVVPYGKQQIVEKSLKTRVFTDKLGEILLGPAYFEALYYSTTGLMPIHNIRRFIGEVQRHFPIKRASDALLESDG